MCADAVTPEDHAAELIPPVQSVAAWLVREVAVLPGYRLHVRFNDGVAGIVDMSALVASPDAGVFSRLRDEAAFAEVFVSYGAVSWPGELDLAPDAMHDAIAATGVWTLK
jgi:hypothetical protein